MAYPRWWTDTVTVYHKTTDGGRVTWTPSTYEGAYFRETVQTATGENATRRGDSAFCRFRVPVPTVDVGDIVILGRTEAEINEYIAGERSSDFLKAHQTTAFVVDSIRDNTHDNTHSPHLYVGGK